MKTIIISLLLFFTINAQNVWYVDRDATGANTGRSWADAWTYLDSSSWAGNKGINWDVISAGDTIYVSGGTDSTVYVPNTYYGFWIRGEDNAPHTFANGNPVVIAPAWQSGHNGTVYFAARVSNRPVLLRVYNHSNIKFTGLNFIDDRSTSSDLNSLIHIGNADYGDSDSLIFFENCNFLSKGFGGLIFLSGTKVTIKNCLLDYVENDEVHDCDPFGISNGRGGHTIDGNKIIMRNGNVGTDAHRDGIQMSNFGNPAWGYIEKLPVTISNNLIIDTRAEGTSWNAMIYSSGPYTSVRYLIYNNIIVSRKNNSSITGIWVGKGGIAPWTNYKTSLYVLNNTVILKGNGTADVVSGYNHDTLIVKNNLFIVDNITGNHFNLDGSDGFPYCFKDIDYNHYTEFGGVNGRFAMDNGLNWSYSQWQTQLNRDAHSTTSNSTEVAFLNKYGLNKEDYYTVTGRDAGVNLSTEYPFLKYDILGNERIGQWDMGALEFGGSQSGNINLRSKIFLQGPFNTNLMNTNLSQNGLLPNNQPFNTAPWNYDGSESLSSGLNSSFVDWVLVELRNSSNPTQVVSRKAAILKNDGTLLNSDGSIGVPFSNVQEGSYYVAVFHRNHLAVMSANPVQLSASSQIYDFTNGMDKAYGTNPMANLGNGIFGMYTGDGNSNGGITIADRNEVWLPQNGTLGYLNGDFNLDGGVTIHDVNLYWNINNGTMTQVP